MTYSELVTRLSVALAEDAATDDAWSSYLPAIIEQAELRCYRDVDFLADRKFITATINAGAGGYLPPADWLLGRTITLVAGAGYVPLERREYSFLLEYSAGFGRPKYWSELSDKVIAFGPLPDIAYTAGIYYHARPAPMTPTNTTTWLGTNAPDLLFYAAMVASSGYQKNFGAQADDPKMAMSWEQQYQTALRAVQREEGRHKGDTSFDHSGAPPPTSGAPPAN